jgi:hypothetical protein
VTLEALEALNDADVRSMVAVMGIGAVAWLVRPRPPIVTNASGKPAMAVLYFKNNTIDSGGYHGL